MKITAVFCVYNEETYLEYAVRSILPAVDEALILLGQAPYDAYNPKAREISQPDQTQAMAEKLARLPHVRLIQGLWSSEVEHRNAGMKICIENRSDYHWLVDGDEVYRQDHLNNIREEIESHPEVGTFIVKCHIFWRSFSYRISASHLAWRPRRIFKVTPHRKVFGVRFPHRCRFTGQNETNSLGRVYEIPTERAVFYHFSYARCEKEMEDKLKTFSHAHEIKGSWLESVWKRWPANRAMTDIHPVDPSKFPQAVHQTPDDLPALMKRHPYYELDVIR